MLIDRAIQTTGECSRSAVTEADLLAWRDLLPAPSILDDALERGLRADLASAACLLTRSSKMKVLRGDNSEDARVIGKIFDPLFTLLGLESLDRMRRAIELCGQPYAEAGPASKALGNPDGHGGPNFNLLRFLERPTTRLIDRQAISKSSLALTRAGLEAELFFVRHGHYPLESTVLDEISAKPFVIDPGEGVIRGSGPGPMDPETLEREDLVWRLLPR
jgi:hypothetical protein